ncbi:hypothetical protein [Peribacillus frigoritolerans]|uniref:DUF2188 domain-containing protein n=1 Tax=Peribacillus castrilensis TaxID=2897690 RepID=A0AAW9NG45_9BACI|nr:hypothetical protein [Peribacillus castrilensis]
MVVFRVEYWGKTIEGDDWKIMQSEPYDTYDEADELRAKMDKEPNKYKGSTVISDSSDD